MNTDTGRIYDLTDLYPDEKRRTTAAQLVDLAARDDAQRALHAFRAEHPMEVAYSDPREQLTDEQLRAEFERAAAAGDAVLVSEQVAQKVRLGERELERRAKRRKAAKQARARNR